VKGWNELGDLVSHFEFKNGNPVGFHKSYFLKNKPEKFTRYNSSGEKHGLCESWFENGNRKDSVVYDNGVSVSGRYYYDTGKIRYLENYKGNLTIHGIYYDPKGNIVSRINNGNGVATIFDENGSKPDEYNFKDGKRID
jgi:antitoxin component YwqK of YwqJK toxin-antitoxin module